MTTDGTENPTDQAKEKAASDGGTGTSQEAPTFTKESQDKAVSDALSAAGRTSKQLDDLRKDVDKQRTELTKSTREARQSQRVAAEERVKDDPAALANLRTSHDADRAIEEADRAKQEAAETTRVAREATTKAIAARLGAEHNVDPAMLLAITDGSEESMETLAKVLPKKGQESADTTPETTRQATPDSGVTTGSGTGKVTRGEAATFTTEGKTFAEIQEMKERLLNSPKT
ncbi:hypothetical protein LCGC14_1967800 [marine sediment metagenome]|uniref:Scaffolding protein n=1 Tax=marine sediment metagenome TaxID=412755 RepID=A0A0F9HR26_9ZZZZ